ncbi:MAG TPA: hypothetical protein VET87_12205 [Rubrivivax sp.]|nr:hypothetical protein [Rubrivivax sp.]
MTGPVSDATSIAPMTVLELLPKSPAQASTVAARLRRMKGRSNAAPWRIVSGTASTDLSASMALQLPAGDVGCAA